MGPLEVLKMFEYLFLQMLAMDEGYKRERCFIFDRQEFLNNFEGRKKLFKGFITMKKKRKRSSAIKT